MQQYIPDEKLSKKRKKELAQQKRSGWGSLSPITRKTETPQAYRRSQEKQWKKQIEYEERNNYDYN